MAQSRQNSVARLVLVIILTIFRTLKLFAQYIIELFRLRKLKDVSGSVVLITGAANGIGRELALQFAKRGSHIAVVDVDLDGAKKTVQEVQDLGVKSEAFKTDVSNFEEVEKLKNAVENALGPVDILVNNAGIFLTRDIVQEDPKNLMRMININLMSHFWTNKVFLEGMIERKRGHIVAVSSLAGIVGLPEGLTYSTSKFGIRGFMESLSLELYHRGQSYIKTTCIFPYFIRTSPDVTNSVNQGLKVKFLINPTTAAKMMTNGILRDEEIVTVPRPFYYLLYLLNLPIGLKKLLTGAFVNDNFRGVEPSS